MVAVSKKDLPGRNQKSIQMGGFNGINYFGPHSSILPTDLRDASNLDIYPGYLKHRRGSVAFGISSGKISATIDVRNGVTWKIGSSEYLIYQTLEPSSVGKFYAYNLTDAGTAPALIASITGSAFTVGGTTIADMKLSGDKIYVFLPTQNYIIQWTGSVFIIRQMGLAKCYLTSLAAGSATGPTGLYTVGVEFVYQPSGVDLVDSGPTRKTFAGKQLEIQVTNQKITVTVDSGHLPASPGDYWTHVRVWRSKRRDTDFTDPTNPIEAAGISSELYPEQLITKAALVSASYVVTLSKLDSELPGDITSEYPILTSEYMEIEPLPNSYTGAYHRNRIWVSRSQGVNDTSQSAIYYSNSAGDAYSEQYRLTNILTAERGDGQETVKLIPFEADLIILKRAKTMRIVNGDPDLGIEVMDPAIGVTSFKLATFVPKLGICAITNDQGDFRIFGYDLRWTNIFNGMDISRPIRDITAAIAASPTYVSFIYINGKLMIFKSNGTAYVFHVKEGMGWGVYNYPMAFSQFAFTYSGGALVIGSNSYNVMIENVDDNWFFDLDPVTGVYQTIATYFTTPHFHSDNGRDILEMEYLSIRAFPSATSVTSGSQINLSAYPFANGTNWPVIATPSLTGFLPSLLPYTQGAPGLEREYRLYLQQKMISPFQHFQIQSQAPCYFMDFQWNGIVDSTGQGAGYFDPYITLSAAATNPAWNT